MASLYSDKYEGPIQFSWFGNSIASEFTAASFGKRIL